MEDRKQGIALAARLQDLLGEGYKVCYDQCESCMTYVYYKGYLVKAVPNEEINPHMSVYSFALDLGRRLAIDAGYDPDRKGVKQ